MERSGGPHSDSGSNSPTWDRDRRGPPPGPPPPGVCIKLNNSWQVLTVAADTVRTSEGMVPGLGTPRVRSPLTVVLCVLIGTGGAVVC